MEQQNNGKGKFNSNFGFLMASIGSAVGLGNLWGFPYKMGNGGGFAFLILYLLLAIVIGYSCMVGEFAIGRKSGKAALGAFSAINKRYVFNGWFETLVPFFLLCFYCTLGGYCIKYLVANFGDIFGASWGVGGAESGPFFDSFVQDTPSAVIYGLLFLVLTVVIVIGGVSGGIEKFSTVAMPALFIMLIIVVIRSVTLPGAGEGLAFIFKPNFEAFAGWGWVKVLASAGGQMFFSLSLASGCLIAYGSYLDKNENLEKNAILVPIADTSVALLAAMAVMPALFAQGLEPAAGPGMLFVSLQTVFTTMGSAGPIFGTIFYLLVFIAAITSSIGMMEGAVSVFMDRAIEKGKKANRVFTSCWIGGVAAVGSTVVSIDALGAGGLPHLFGFETWLDTFDLFAEGFLMPLGAFCMAIMLGWLRPDYIDDEVKLGSNFKSRGFVKVCLKWIAPFFMIFIMIGQLDGFFKWGFFN